MISETENSENDNLAEQSRSVAVVFNPVSGQNDPDTRKQEIEAAFDTIGYRCRHFETTEEIGAKDHVATILQNDPPFDLIAVSGGDGTVVGAISALVGQPIPLNILPAGTGNLLAHNLNLPLAVAEAINVVQKGTVGRIDIAILRPDNDSESTYHFAIVAGIGFDAHMIRDTDREAKNRFGGIAYFLAALKHLYRRPVKARIYLDDAEKPIIRRARSVMVANMGKLQGGIEIAPALPTDGLLTVMILKAETMHHWLRLVWNTIRHRLADEPMLEYHNCRRVRVELSRRQPLQYDGELHGRVHGFSAEIVPSAVGVYVPKDDKAPTDA